MRGLKQADPNRAQSFNGVPSFTLEIQTCSECILTCREFVIAQVAAPVREQRGSVASGLITLASEKGHTVIFFVNVVAHVAMDSIK